MKKGQNLKYSKPYFNSDVNTNTEANCYIDRFFHKYKSNKIARNLVRNKNKK